MLLLEPKVEPDVRAYVEDLVLAITAIVRKSVLETVTRHLNEAVDALAKARAPGRGKPVRPGARAPGPAPRASVDVRGSGSGRAGPAPQASVDVRGSGSGRAGPAPQAPSKAKAGRSKPARATPPAQASKPKRATPTGASVARTLLEHVKIEPGQGRGELALAMGAPAATLDAPLRQLLAQKKIRSRRERGGVAYYPA